MDYARGSYMNGEGKPNVRIDNFIKLLKASSNELDINASYLFNGVKAKIDRMNEIDIISDANIDLMGLLMTNDT